ncbi:uncharacterized protein LOC110608890 [Manihot esculenta]|uniref:uncharacterized protein LOC110608890 n=1 Tax=Manihot esculenta TaxID=3983 RepID=UPI000B5D5DDB|nr:uncharacterized protein LOC110608890 [Manihot esculenta]
MASSSRAAANIATNEGVIISSALDNREKTPPVVNEMEESNHEIACEALKKVTRNVKFMDSLIKNPAATYQQLIDKAQKCIRLDDEIQALKEDKMATQKQNQRSKRQGHEGDHRSYIISRRRNDQNKYKNYTPLNDSRICILMWIRKKDIEIRWLSKLNLEKAEKRDRTKYFRFHKDCGHTIEECQQLMMRLRG